MLFGRKMQAMRVIHGYTQEELASLSGVNAAYICRIENGRQIVTNKEERAIRKALDWAPKIDALLEAAAEYKITIAEEMDSGLRRNDEAKEGEACLARTEER